MRFGDWLRNSNEAKPYRDALDAIDKIPTAHGLKMAAFTAVSAKISAAWTQTKIDLEL